MTPPEVNTYLYVDDIALVTNSLTVKEISDKLSEVLAKSSTWLTDHKLSLNIPKAKSMIHGTAQRVNSCDKLTVLSGGESIDTMCTFKYLGVMIDQNLKFDAHVTYLKHKVFTRLKALGKARQFIDQNLSIGMYKSLIMPHLDYADIIYDAMHAKSAKQLQLLQNCCLRICLQLQFVLWLTGACTTAAI